MPFPQDGCDEPIAEGTEGAFPLRLAREAAALLRAEAERSYPLEACGLLIGRTTDRGAFAVRATRARNLAPDEPERTFVLDPADWLQAEEEAAARGLEILGVWHSHPDHPPRPSPRDRESAWPDLSYVIVEVRGGRSGTMRSWRLSGERFVEETLLEATS